MKEGKPYFAYGSNLNTEDLKSWCEQRNVRFPLVRKIGKGYLPDWEPVFDFFSPMRGGGALNITNRNGQIVPGVLFEVDKSKYDGADGWSTLDLKEGTPDVYDRSNVFVLTEDGGQVEAVTYEVVPEKRKKFFVPPTDEYTETVRDGYREHCFSVDILSAVAGNRPVPWFLDSFF